MKKFAFRARLTKPGKGNKYYIRKANGGYSDAILGKPTDPECNVLSNCFSGETKYVTDEGLKTFAETVGTVQNVLNEDGEFVPAEIKSFGEQPLMKVTLGNGDVFFATENHRWVVQRLSAFKEKRYSHRRIKTTNELNRWDHIPYNFPATDFAMSNEGIVHGIVFGDGSKCVVAKTYHVDLFGNKEELRKYLPEHIYGENLKEVPPITKDAEYLRGFVAGLIATDGCICADTFSVSNISYDALKAIENICYKIGVAVGRVGAQTRDVSIGKYEYKDHTIYELSFKRHNIDKLLLKSADLAKLTSPRKDIKYTTVKSVEPTDRVEEVFCAVEPKTHTITLEHNILTGQCSGYSYGRFNEVGGWGECKYLAPVNAEHFMDFKGDCKTGMTPKLGACMVWQKGATKSGADGAGHVASVEQVVSPTCVVTSESSYGGEAFYTKRREKGDGRWGQPKEFTFLGFIYNPAVPDEEVELKVGDVVNFVGKSHYLWQNGTVGFPAKPGKAVITKINLGAKHPYHLVRDKSGGSNVYGWVDASDIYEAPKPEWIPKVGDVVYFNGGDQYQWQNGTEARQATAGMATITKIYTNGAKHPYHLIRVKGGTSDVWGFVDRETFEQKAGVGYGDI